MKKRTNWASALFAAFAIAGAIVVALVYCGVCETKVSPAVQKELGAVSRADSLKTEGNQDRPYIDPTGLIEIVYPRSAGIKIEAEFISVEDLTTGTTCDRSKPIELKADHEYCIIYTLPDEESAFDWENAVFKVDWQSLRIEAGYESPLKSILSDGMFALYDSVEFISPEQPLTFWDINSVYRMYGDAQSDEVSMLDPALVEGYFGTDGAALRDNLRVVKRPQHITYTFHAVECNSEQSSYAAGDAVPMNPDPYFYGPSEAGK